MIMMVVTMTIATTMMTVTMIKGYTLVKHGNTFAIASAYIYYNATALCLLYCLRDESTATPYLYAHMHTYIHTYLHVPTHIMYTHMNAHTHRIHLHYTVYTQTYIIIAISKRILI